MNKLLCLSFVGVALTAQPAIGSDNQIRAVLASERCSIGADATTLIPEKVKEVLDRVRAAPAQPQEAVHPAVHKAAAQSMQLAAISNGVGAPPPAGTAHVSPSRDESDLREWTLLPAALLLIAFIIRRRTAVR